MGCGKTGNVSECREIICRRSGVDLPVELIFAGGWVVVFE